MFVKDKKWGDVLMLNFVQTFIGIKITLSFTEKNFKQLVADFDIKIENNEGKSLEFSHRTLNIEKVNRVDSFFNLVLQHILNETEDLTFEEYHGNKGEVNLLGNTMEELIDEHKEYQDFRQKILDVVGQNWIDMIGCYWILQG